MPAGDTGSAAHWRALAVAHEFNTFLAMHGAHMATEDLRERLFGGAAEPAAGRLEAARRMVAYLRAAHRGDVARMRDLEARCAPGPVFAVLPETPWRLVHALRHRDTGFSAAARERQAARYDPVLAHLEGAGAPPTYPARVDT